MPALKLNEYKCAVCKEIFGKGWSDDQALEEKEKLWPGVPLEACAVVCDDCFTKMVFG